MQMLNQQNKNRKIQKSQLLLFGSFLIFVGVMVMCWPHLKFIKENIYSDMQVAISERMNDNRKQDIIKVDVPEADNLDDKQTEEPPQEEAPIVEDFSKYLGVLEIPRIGLKRGFYGTDSAYNDIQYNVTMVVGSTMPDVDRGNLILIAHSGDAYISFFAYLYRLKVGNDVFVTYNGVRYQYRIVNIYNVEKNGTVSIIRNYDQTTLTLITCTKDDSSHQTVYIAERV